MCWALRSEGLAPVVPNMADGMHSERHTALIMMSILKAVVAMNKEGRIVGGFFRITLGKPVHHSKTLYPTTLITLVTGC